MKRYALLIVMLFSAAAFAQGSPRIAVYVTGNVGEDVKEALGTRMLASLVNSGRYIAIERSNAFLAEIEKEHVKQRSGDIDDSQISQLGKQFGVKFVCIAAITPALGSNQVSARIVNVETAVVVFIGESSSPLKSMEDLERVSDQVVKNMFRGKTTPTPRQDLEHTAATPDDLKKSVLPMTVVSASEVRKEDLKATMKALEGQYGLRFGIGNAMNFEIILSSKSSLKENSRMYNILTFGYHTHDFENGDISGNCNAFEGSLSFVWKFNVTQDKNLKWYIGPGYGMAFELISYEFTPSNNSYNYDYWDDNGSRLSIGSGIAVNSGFEYNLGRRIALGVDIRPVYYGIVFMSDDIDPGLFFRYTFGVSARYRY